ncbi:MAG TPA: 16S rRNA (guanine(966)-N(2))-methyltransferase RsmD [Steroidobacteraceae bacterium]|nr:16S rRNA (guanine(966)-N(2))-methyltransferase RsmD [Steroidobacteraceae bacterium]
MKRSAGEVRIIGGRLRGRRIAVPDAPGLRPTPDRVRETLFNWVGPTMAGARVLDLFAGTGALGLEALSRGAAAVTLVEQQRVAVSALQQTVQRLGVPEVRIVAADALSFLASDKGQYDLILLDPPFAAGLLAPAVQAIVRHQRLAPDGVVYVEQPQDAGPPALPEGWNLHRSGRAGEVGYYLLHGASRDLSGHI